jgi:hypothetical protein
MNDATQFFNTVAGAGGYEIERSLRFNSADSAYLSRLPSVAGNRKTWTWAGWVKRSKLGDARLSLFTAGSDGAEFFFEQSAGADTLKFYYYNNSASAYQGDCRTTAVFRDASAWYHIVLTVDTTQATASNRCKIYVNGVQQDTTFANDFIQNADLDVNNTVAHNIGKYGSSSSNYFDGYLADIHFIDGQALDPSSFGEFDTNGVWQPIAYAGSYGTNGFHLPFSDNSGTTTSANAPSPTPPPVASRHCAPPTCRSQRLLTAARRWMWRCIRVTAARRPLVGLGSRLTLFGSKKGVVLPIIIYTTLFAEQLTAFTATQLMLSQLRLQL